MIWNHFLILAIRNDYYYFAPNYSLQSSQKKIAQAMNLKHFVVLLSKCLLIVLHNAHAVLASTNASLQFSALLSSFSVFFQ